GYRFSFFLHSKKPMKTTHKPRQELKPVKNTKSYRYAEIRHKTVTFLYAGKSDVRNPVNCVSLVISMQKTLHARSKLLICHDE
ncbi:MAG: hypothetical protein OXD54_11215, partial [Candidatus Poribacteria bacterium]|nr:hypothetical protein [Candidatus Poribacteria bacterium]